MNTCVFDKAVYIMPIGEREANGTWDPVTAYQTFFRDEDV